MAWSPLGRLQEKERKGFNFAHTPFLVTPNSLPSEGLCSGKIYPFPTQMSLPDQLLEGQAELNPRTLFRAPSQVPVQGSLRSPPTTGATGARAYDPGPPAGLPLRLRRVLAWVAVAGPGNPRLIRRGRPERARGVPRLSRKTVSP